MDPPYKYVQNKKKPKLNEKTGKLVTQDVWYLNNNLFYNNQISFWVKLKVVNYAKDFLMLYMDDIPKLDKARITITYRHTKDTFDLDNKADFWKKILLDIMKTPTDKQRAKAEEKGIVLKTIECLPDDTVRYVDQHITKFERGEHELDIEIFGVLANVQADLFDS